MKITINALGEKVNKDIEILAWNNVNSKVEIVYERNPDHIKLLIEQLKKEATALEKQIDEKYFTEDYWMNTRCTKRGGRCTGGCSGSKSCQECCITSCYCCCR